MRRNSTWTPPSGAEPAGPVRIGAVPSVGFLVLALSSGAGFERPDGAGALDRTPDRRRDGARAGRRLDGHRLWAVTARHGDGTAVQFPPTGRAADFDDCRNLRRQTLIPFRRT
ncbi:hypothetical protein BRC93_12370 [Halobacteriales archaeon QS_5_70_15]|nr:MAG: hypothetical protein BRC93_12370 [Halobacteriales archaeon QS_5_70_15]